MQKPVIALTPQYTDDNERTFTRTRYFDAIFRHGGLPISLPQASDEADIKQYASAFDGFLFIGGDDVNPKLYGEEILPECGFISSGRDIFEIALLKEILIRDKPVLGICRGMQIINVALSGSLYQHVDGHKNCRHIVNFCGEKVEVNSLHHQAIKKLANELKISATDENGIIEAVYMPGKRYVTAVQWHPEIFDVDKDNSLSTKLFTEFIEACKIK